MYMYLQTFHVEDNSHNTSHPHSNPFHLICFISFPLSSTTIKTFPFSIYRFTYVSKPGVLSPKTSTQFSINILRKLQKKDLVMGLLDN